MGSPTTARRSRARPTASSATSVPPQAATALEAVRSLARLSRLLERATGELGMAQYRVLSAVAAGEHRASRVATRLGLGRPTVSVAVDALYRRGLLMREDAPGDHRVTVLSVTPKGDALLGKVEAAMVAVLGDLCARTPATNAAPAALASLGPALDALEAHRPRHGAARA